MSSLELLTYPAGPIETNGFLVIDPETNEALIIDAPSGVTPAIVRDIETRSVTVKAIVITHGHWDHIGDTAELKRSLGAPVLAHPTTDARLQSPASATSPLPVEIETSSADQHITDGDVVELGSHRFDVWFLSGHDPGHVVLISLPDKLVLGGDVLFPGGHGRIDIPGANAVHMQASLARLATLPDDTVVHPGHGLPTTIGNERGWLPS